MLGAPFYRSKTTGELNQEDSPFGSSPIVSYGRDLALNPGEILVDALHGQFDLVRRPHQFTQSCLGLGASSSRQTALEDGELKPIPVPMHGL